MRRLPPAVLLSLAALAAWLPPGAAEAHDESLPVVDLAVVSKTASVTRAHPHQLVTYTIVAVNNGPDATTLDVSEPTDSSDLGFVLVDEQCDLGVSADTPSCEYGAVPPGETVTTTVTVRVLPRFHAVTNTACASSEELVLDTDPANNCLTTVLQVGGRPR
jgi:uncharacterized repeat protein (TIGR01451 family)